MNDKKTSVSIDLGGKTLTLETGTLAPQATAGSAGGGRPRPYLLNPPDRERL